MNLSSPSHPRRLRSTLWRARTLAPGMVLAACATQAPVTAPAAATPLTVQLRDTGTLDVGGVAVADASLSAAVAARRGDKSVIVRAPDAARWSDVIHVLDALAQANVPTMQLGSTGSTAPVSGSLAMPHFPTTPVPVVTVDLDARTSTLSVDGHAVGTEHELEAELAKSVTTGGTVVVRADARVPFVRVLDAVLRIQHLGGAVVFGVIPSTTLVASRRRDAKPAAVDWNCPFPKEADDARIDHAMVVVRIDVDASGRPTHVEVFEDPGKGFGDAAKACALGTTYEPALGDDGKAVAGQTHKLRVRFER